MDIKKDVENKLSAALFMNEKDYSQFSNEFGHLEGDTIVGLKHKSAVITLVERLSKSYHHIETVW